MNSDSGKAGPFGGLFLRLLRNIDIRYRLITSFILVSLIPLSVFGAMSYLESREAIKKKTGVFEAEIVRQVVRNIQAIMEQEGSDAVRPPVNPRSPQFHFSSIFDGVNVGDAAVFVLDINDGRILIRPVGDAAPADAVDAIAAAAVGGSSHPKFADPGLLSSIGRIVGSGGGANFVSYNGAGKRDYLAAFATVPDTTWAVVSTIPQRSLAGTVHSLRNKIIAIGTLCAIFVLLVSYVICRSISVPLNRLVGGMKQTDSGDYRLRLRCDGNDEIALLSHKFNEMAGIMHQHSEQLDQLVAARTHLLKEANLKLEALSATDVLTGLANRRRLDEVLASELRRAIRSAKPLAVIMVDVDFFKKYNDHYGHQAGDACLRKVAQALQSGCHRGGDLVARYGGEEFVLVAADTDLAGALILAEMSRNAIESLCLPHDESAFGQVTISVGVAAVQPSKDHTPDILLHIADRAMYRAKVLGRNRVAAHARELMDD